MNEEILKQLTRIADALELAILPQNNTAYADKVKETLNVDDAQQELAPEVTLKDDLTFPVYMNHSESCSVYIANNEEELDSALANMADIVSKEFYEKCKAEYDQPAKTYTHDDLKALCLAKSREDIVNKPKLKGLLKEYGAAKANDVPKDKLAELINKIESGEF